MDKEQFLIKLKLGITSVLTKIEDKENLFEFGIFTNQEVSSMTLYYNTYTHFARHLNKAFLQSHRIDFGARWAMPGWFKQTGEEDALFNEANNLLHHTIQPREAQINPQGFKDVLWDILTRALLELREEGWFPPSSKGYKITKEPILYIQQADAQIDDAMRQRVKKLQGEERYKEFLYDFREEPGFAGLVNYNLLMD